MKGSLTHRPARFSRRGVLQSAGLGTVGAIGLATVGCGDDNEEAPSATATTSTQTSSSPTQAPAETPVAGGRLRMHDQAPIHFDPFTTGSNVTHRARSFTNDKLITYAYGPDVGRGERRLEAQLAEGWENPDPEGLTWIFKLRKDVKFHNVDPVNGRAFTSEDARWSFDRGAQQGAFQYGEFRSLIKSITAVDGNTLRVDLSEPYAPFLQYVASDYSWIVAPESAKDGDFRSDSSMIGTGPFVLKDSQADRSLTFDKNPDYFVPGRPYVDGVDWTIAVDVTALASGLLAGTADITGGAIPREERSRYKDAGVVLSDPELGGFNLIYMRADQKPFDDIRVRRAVALAIDRQGIIDGLFGGDGEQSSALPPWWPDWWVHPKDLGPASDNFLRYAPKEAKDLLSAAGFSSGLSTNYHSTQTAFGVTFNQLLEVTQQQLAAVGINAKLSLNDYAQFTAIVNNTREAGYDGMAFSPRGFYADISGYLVNMYYPGQSRNYVRVDDADLNTLLIAQQRELNAEKRKSLVVDVQRYLAKNPYYVTMPCETTVQGFGKRIGHVANWGGTIGGYDPGHRAAAWWIKA
ncbi:MAG: ABC transporter substrate-binding protein [Dehalococcoidia bacterium]